MVRRIAFGDHDPDEGRGVDRLPIDGDPLFNAQDMKITAFVIGQPEYDKAGSDKATVNVTFRNFGKPDKVSFLLRQDAAKNWKIVDIRYKDGTSLKGLLTEAQKQP